jgi:hypothetical protein
MVILRHEISVYKPVVEAYGKRMVNEIIKKCMVMANVEALQARSVVKGVSKEKAEKYREYRRRR